MPLLKLKFHPRFIDELESAITYYNGKSRIVGQKFKSATQKQLNVLKKAPRSKTIRYDDIRFARIEKYPYAIHYSIDTTENSVLVHSLLCDFQDPETHWGKRF